MGNIKSGWLDRKVRGLLQDSWKTSYRMWHWNRDPGEMRQWHVKIRGASRREQQPGHKALRWIRCQIQGQEEAHIKKAREEVGQWGARGHMLKAGSLYDRIIEEWQELVYILSDDSRCHDGRTETRLENQTIVKWDICSTWRHVLELQKGVVMVYSDIWFLAPRLLGWDSHTEESFVPARFHLYVIVASTQIWKLAMWGTPSFQFVP